MGRMGCFVFGMILGAAVIYTSLKFHIVRAHDGYHMIPKLSAELSDTYVDVRDFGFAEWGEHQSLALAITRADKAYLLQQGAVDGLRKAVEDAFQLPRSP